MTQRWKKKGESLDKKSKSIVLIADKVGIVGPLIDGGYKLSFYVGEYEQSKVAKLLSIPQQTELQLEIKLYSKRGGEEND